MLRLISTLDSLIQKGVDEAVVAVMRTCGVRKSFIAYVLHMLVAGTSVMNCIRHRDMFFLFFGAFWVAVGWHRLRRDEAADGAGKLGPGDNQLAVVKLFLWAMLGFSVFVSLSPWTHIQNVVLLLSEYLCGTSKTPPPKKQRSPSLSAAEVTT